MNGWAIFGEIVAAVIVATLLGFALFSASDIRRYMRIRRM